MGLEKEAEKRPYLQGFVGHVKEFGFYPKDNGDLLKDFNKGSSKVTFSFKKINLI